MLPERSVLMSLIVCLVVSVLMSLVVLAALSAVF
jgi:hypothetical protein